MKNINVSFKALNDEVRLSILEMLKEGELCACDILENLSISQSTLSHHMKLLYESELVNVRKESKWSHYSINQKTMKVLEDYLHSFSSIKIESNSSC